VPDVLMTAIHNMTSGLTADALLKNNSSAGNPQKNLC
jgi:hypothetical protein